MTDRAPAPGDMCVSVAGGSLPVDVSGTGTCAVLAVHGWTLDRRVWHAQHEGLAGAMRVLSFDRRGFGASDAAPLLGQEPGDISAILDHCGIDAAWLIGQSQGARVALAFARAEPRRVRGLVLQGAPPLAGMAGAAIPDIPLVDYAAAVREGDITAVRRQWLSHPLMHTNDPVLASLLASMVEHWDGADLVSGAAGLPLSLDDLAAISCPVLILTGADEPASRHAAARAMAAAMPDATHLIIPGGGHLCNAEQPAAFNAAVADFIARH